MRGKATRLPSSTATGQKTALPLTPSPPHPLPSFLIHTHTYTPPTRGETPSPTHLPAVMSDSSSSVDIVQLSESQREALEQFTAVTAQSPIEAIPLLRRSQWNVQVWPLASTPPPSYITSLNPPPLLLPGRNRKILRRRNHRPSG